MYEYLTSLFITSLRSISRIRSRIHFPNLDLYFSLEVFSTELIHITINAITPKMTTPEEQALDNFTRINLKSFYTWDEWEQGKRNKIIQMHDLEMFGKPIDAPKNSNILIIHWKYDIKRYGTCIARQCCYGSKRAAHMLRELTLTYCSCL